VLAAEIAVESPDFGHLSRRSRRPPASLRRQASQTRPGSSSPTPATGTHEQIDRLAANGIAVLIPPMPRSERMPAPAGRAAATSGCAACSRPSSASGSTETVTDDRADVRAHQAQPRDEPLSATRQVGRAHRMAPDHGHPQPLEAPQPHPGGRNDMNRAERPPPSSAWAVHRRPARRVGFRATSSGESESAAAVMVSLRCMESASHGGIGASVSDVRRKLRLTAAVVDGFGGTLTWSLIVLHRPGNVAVPGQRSQPVGAAAIGFARIRSRVGDGRFPDERVDRRSGGWDTRRASWGRAA
jgi:hypothetical protein